MRLSSKTKGGRHFCAPTPSEALVKSKIYTIRGQKVMLDFDLAAMYGVKTGRLNEQVKRNIERFPEDFMFQLTKSELEILRSQILALQANRVRAVTTNDLISQIATSKPIRYDADKTSVRNIKHFMA